MPEEINRILTDAIADFLFTPSRDADLNLLGEGIPPERIHFVGNVMIDSLLGLLAKTDDRETLSRFQVKEGNYATLTLHRPSNVDDRETLSGIVDVLLELCAELTLVWPVHPRTKKNLEKFDLWPRLARCQTLKLSPPLGYLDMLALNRKARLIVTDSGGLQEEATILRVPCVTLRDNTERPVTVAVGCNRLAGNRPCRIRAAVGSALSQNRQEIGIPEGWDGRAAERVVDVILSHSIQARETVHGQSF
jgi:UDP-N-acetylglucosamine 2-epimerase (non-hydrolysing)